MRTYLCSFKDLYQATKLYLPMRVLDLMHICIVDACIAFN